jgi:spore maturation protein CgeB
MKIVIVGRVLTSNVERFLSDAFQELGHETQILDTLSLGRVLYGPAVARAFISVGPVRRTYEPFYDENVNRKVRAFFEREKPDFVVCHNAGELNSETIEYLTKTRRVPVGTLVMDDPTTTFYLANYLAAIPYFSHLFVSEKGFIPKLSLLSQQKIMWLPCGTSPQSYRPVKATEPEYDQFECNLGYASTAYGARPPGIYRALVLRHVKDFGLRIFGDPGWKLIARKVPEIADCLHTTGALNSEQMCALFARAKIFMSIGHPQMITGVTQRIFDAAAAGAFQIAEAKAEVLELFPDQSVETFSTIPELREKTGYYLAHPEERQVRSDNARARVLAEHTWKHRAHTILETVFG